MVENAWWVMEYGEPCRECGFEWAMSPEAAIAAVEALPDQFATQLADRSGEELGPGATWSAKAYVFHVADNLRIFAERLEGVAAGGSTAIAPYDENQLAAARDYEAMSLPSALWSLRTAAAVWVQASRAALIRPTLYQHPERGELTAAEIVRGPAHDALHHFWDVTRAVTH